MKPSIWRVAVPSFWLCLSVVVGAGCSTTPQGTSSSGTSGTHGSGVGTATAGSNGTTGSNSGGGDLGFACNSNANCGTLQCLTAIPQGYCSATCATSADCPSNGSCVGVLPGEEICIQSCQGDSDCTRAGYKCDPGCKVCIPLATVGQVACGGSELGAGGHLADGGACGALPASGGTPEWSASVDVSSSPATFYETEGALSSDGVGHLVAAFEAAVDAGAGGALNGYMIGVASSSNDGTSFVVGAPLVSASDLQLFDPTLARDANGTTYLAYAGYSASTKESGEVYLSSSTDNGLTWSAPQNMLSAADIAPTGGAVDKPFLVVHPITQMPMVIFSDITGPFGGGSSRIKLIAGLGGGQGFSASVDVDDGTAAALVDLPTMAFDSVGNLYAAWVQAEDNRTVADDQNTGTLLAGSALDQIDFAGAAFVDGGLAAPSLPSTVVSQMSDLVVLDSARVAVAQDGSAVYVAYVVATADNVTDIVVATSTNHGVSFPTHTRVDDNAGCATHFHPWPFVDAKGRLWVSWVDNRDGAGHVFYAVSSDLGQTFSQSQLLSDAPFEFTTLIPSTEPVNGVPTFVPVPAWLGGYQWLGGTSTELYSLWPGAIGATSVQSPSHLYFSKATLP